MSAAFDWLSCVVMLVLAGLVTLSIIGAIASIPSGSIGTRIGFERPEPPATEAESREAPLLLSSSEEGTRAPARVETATKLSTSAGGKREPTDWLEAITYALIALAGLAALGCLLLWRSLSRQSRIADALEVLTRRGGFT